MDGVSIDRIDITLRRAKSAKLPSDSPSDLPTSSWLSKIQ